MRNFLRSISGNPRALARVVAILLLLVAALVLAIPLKADPKLLVGSFVGAALSLAVASLVAMLEAENLGNVPGGFLAAARKDVEQASYYRENQKIRISISADDARKEIIELRFTADIVPANSVATIERPKVSPPRGVSLAFVSYKVGRDPLSEYQDREIHGRTTDELVVRYRVDRPSTKFVEDAHHWPSPVLDYSVEFGPSEDHSFEVGKIVAGAKSIALTKRRVGRSKVEEFVGDGPAFRTQGLKWKITRSALA